MSSEKPRMTEEEHLTAEGVPPGPDLETRKQHLVSEAELFGDLDIRVASHIPDQRDSAKTKEYIKTHGLDIKKINSKLSGDVPKAKNLSNSAEDGLTQIEEGVPRPDVKWLPVEYQTAYDALEGLIEQLLIDAIINTPPGEAAHAQHRAEQVRSEIRRAIKALHSQNPGPEQIKAAFKNYYDKIQAAKK